MADTSVRKLAAASGVDKTTIQRWKKGEQPRVEVAAVRKVAHSLGTTAEDLLDIPAGAAGTAPPTPPPRADVLRQRIAALDPEDLAALERTLPPLRKAAEEVRKGR